MTPVLGGRFVRLDYTWGYQGKPQEGSLLVGFDPQSGEVSGHWIDTWHMGRLVLSLRREAAASGTIAVRGSYAAPPGPDWGWRIEIAPGERRPADHAHEHLPGREGGAGGRGRLYPGVRGSR